MLPIAHSIREQIIEYQKVNLLYNKYRLLIKKRECISIKEETIIILVREDFIIRTFLDWVLGVRT